MVQKKKVKQYIYFMQLVCDVNALHNYSYSPQDKQTFLAKRGSSGAMLRTTSVQIDRGILRERIIKLLRINIYISDKNLMSSIVQQDSFMDTY